jgi:hypothetical protein
MSNRQELLAALVGRLSAITIAGGFSTDAGLTLFLGDVPALGPDDPDSVLAVVVGDDNPKWQGQNLLIGLPVHVAMIAKADLDDAWLTIEAMLADVKRAVELEDRTLGKRTKGPIERGTTRTMPREPGSTTVGTMITYWLPYTEVWGNP